MAEIAAARGSTGLRIVSTFSGCGGSCLGFEMAGYRVAWASEFVEAARDVYALNHAGVVPDARDIRLVTAADVLRATGLAVGDLDVLEGSPPCASFSTAGNREGDWGKVKSYSDTKQRTDDLFLEYVRLVDGLRPRAFVAENVSGLVKGKAAGYFQLVLRQLRALGYRVGAQLLNAMWLGVPQDRARLIFVGVREDLGVEPPFPLPRPYCYSIRDALPWIRSVVHDTSGAFGSGECSDRPAPTISVGGPNVANRYHFKVDGPVVDGSTHEPMKLREGGRSRKYAPPPELVAHEEPPQIAWLRDTAVAREWDKLRPGETSERYFNLVRPDPDRPCPTVTAQGGTSAGTASVTHPLERRKFTIQELRLVCGFPADFQLVGTYAQQWERLGRAVPPRMMHAVAAALRDRVFAPLGLVHDGWREAP